MPDSGRGGIMAENALLCLYSLDRPYGFPFLAAGTQPVQLLAREATVNTTVYGTVSQQQLPDTAHQTPFTRCQASLIAGQLHQPHQPSYTGPDFQLMAEQVNGSLAARAVLDRFRQRQQQTGSGMLFIEFTQPFAGTSHVTMRAFQLHKAVDGLGTK